MPSNTRRLRVGWSSEDMKKEDIGLKDSHTFISIHNTHIPSGCLSQGRREHSEGQGSVTQPWCAGPLSHVVLIFHSILNLWRPKGLKVLFPSVSLREMLPFATASSWKAPWRLEYDLTHKGPVHVPRGKKQKNCLHTIYVYDHMLPRRMNYNPF